MKKTIQFLALVLVAALFASCSDAVYEEHKDVTGILVWKKDDVKVFSPNIADDKEYNVILALRHHSLLGEKSFPVKITMKAPDGTETDLSMDFPIRGENGELVGEAAGDLCDTETVILPNFKFPATGGYTFTVSQATEADEVPSIMEIGMRITPVVKE